MNRIAGLTLNLTFFNWLTYVNSISCCSLPAWSERQLSKLLGIKFELRGHENIVQDSGCVVLMNHQSALDILGESCGLHGTGLPPSHSHTFSEILNNQYSILLYDCICFIHINLRCMFYATVCCSRHKDSLQLVSIIFKKKNTSILVDVLYISNWCMKSKNTLDITCFKF